jgi:hypothetical protein
MPATEQSNSNKGDKKKLNRECTRINANMNDYVRSRDVKNNVPITKACCIFRCF